jgi:hypothetical protein
MMQYICDFDGAILAPGNLRYEATDATGAKLWDSCANDVVKAVHKYMQTFTDPGRITITATIVTP